MRPARIPRDVPQKSAVKAETRRERTAARHVQFVRDLRICTAGAHEGKVDPHHLMRGEGVERGMLYKSQGRYAIPLCRKHHTEITRKPDDLAWLMAEHGIDGLALANRLYAISGDHAEGVRAVLRANEEARLKRRQR